MWREEGIGLESEVGRGKEDGRIKRIGMEWKVRRQDVVGIEEGVGSGEKERCRK